MTRACLLQSPRARCSAPVWFSRGLTALVTDVAKGGQSLVQYLRCDRVITRQPDLARATSAKAPDRPITPSYWATRVLQAFGPP
jgi:hypothetical protein